MPFVQIAAHVSTAFLIACAWKLRRVRTYALSMLVSDLTRLFLMSFEPSMLLYGLDGALILATPVILAWGLEVPWKPVAGLGMASLAFALFKMHEGDNEAVTGIYTASLCVSHAAITVLAISSRKWRRNLDASGLVLWVSAASGFAGTLVVITWGEWDLVCVSNVVVNVLLAALCLFLGRDDDRV